MTKWPMLRRVPKVGFDEWFKLAVVALVGVVGWVFKGHENRLAAHDVRLAATDKTFAERAQRIQAIELTRESKVDADKQRDEIRAEIHEFREEVSVKLESIRTEGNDKRDELRQDMAAMRDEINKRLETTRIETNDALREMSAQITALATATAVINVGKATRRRK